MGVQVTGMGVDAAGGVWQGSRSGMGVDVDVQILTADTIKASCKEVPLKSDKGV